MVLYIYIYLTLGMWCITKIGVVLLNLPSLSFTRLLYISATILYICPQFAYYDLFICT